MNGKNEIPRRRLGRLAVAGGVLATTGTAVTAAGTLGAAADTNTDAANTGPDSQTSVRTDRAAGRRPPGRATTSFLFVTGAGGSASVPSELALRGHRVAAVDLPGHGPSAAQFPVSYQAPQDLKALAEQPSPLAGVTLDDYVGATLDCVRRLAEHGPVILVGSSMGGSTITRVANQAPDLLHRVVYDSAYLCVDLATPAEYQQTPEAEGNLGDFLLRGLVGDPTKLGALRVNYRSADPEFLAAGKRAMMADGTAAEFMNLLATLLPDESIAVPSEDARIDPAVWGAVPHSYIRHTQDRMIPIALQDRMIAEADRATGPGRRHRFDVHTVRTSHATTPATYARIVDILDGLAP